MSENRYHVWAFRRINACYDCGQLDKIEAEPNASAVELTESEFNAFQHGVQSQSRYGSEYIYLYRQIGDISLAPKIMELVKLGEAELADKARREEEKKRKAVARAAKAKDAAAKKAEKEAKEKRKLYEQLKAEFGS